MRGYTFILYTSIILQSVTVISAVKYSYGRPTYGDRSLREFEDSETFDAEYGNGVSRSRKYHPNYRYRPSRSGRQRHSSVDHDHRERAYYEGPGRENDPSIEVIVDPGKKKAVAVIENGPAGQSRYELTGYEMAHGFNEPDMQQQQQNANLESPSGKGELRKRSSQKMLDANYENSEMRDSEMQKRNAELTKRKINRASKMANVPFKQDYTDAQVGSLPTKKRSEDSKETAAENCPPHLEEQAKDLKRNEEGQQQKEAGEKSSVKREAASAFSESQLNSLSDSLAKVKDSGEDMEELKRVLYDMGLVHKSKRDALDSLEKQQTKRDLQEGVGEDEDMSKDNIVMKRDSEAGDEDGWNDDDETEFDEQMDKRDAESDNWEDAEEDEGVADEPVEKMKYGTGELAEVKMNDDHAKETADAELPMRDKRQNKENVEPQQENADENQNEMIDNYAKELQQANLEAAARSKREQDKSKMKQSKDDKKRSEGDEDKLIKEAENQVTPDRTNADAKKKLTTKRENAKDDAKEKRQEGDATKKKMESEIKEKIQMIKEKVKREILEENAENSRGNYYQNANFQRSGRAADSLDLDGSFKRSKRDLSGSVKENHDEGNLNQHDLKQNVLPRRANSDGNGTRVAIDYKYNQTDLAINDSKTLDPTSERSNLKSIIREPRAVNATGQTLKTDEALQGTAATAERKEIDAQSDVVTCQAKALAPAVRKRRDVGTNGKAPKGQMVRQKRANGDPEKQMVYEPFQNGEVDESEEEGEFGDNYKDNRLYVDKRQARDDEEEYFEEPGQQRNQQYEERDATYFDGEENPARRRRSFEEEDNARMRTDEREKREPLNGNAKLTDEEEYSENLYFGPLSKTYNEDLVRYKRVKRDKP